MDAKIRKLLFDIEEAGLAIKRFIEYKSLADYEQEEILRSAVERKFEIIGEALNRIQRLDEEFIEQIYQYRRIIGFRNILAHGYDAVSNEIVWEICGEDLTLLLSDVHRPYGNTYAKPQPWWVNDPDSVVHVALVGKQMAGFVINGWRSRVDADTESEILELYVAPGFRGQGVGQQLAALGFSHLVGDAGFQVYLDNPKAERFWNRALAEQKLPYTTYAALENNVPVIKYRFTTPASVVL